MSLSYRDARAKVGLTAFMLQGYYGFSWHNKADRKLVFYYLLLNRKGDLQQRVLCTRLMLHQPSG